MKTLVLITAFLLSLAACQMNNQLPDGILPEGKMKAVLWDMMRADQFLNDFVFSRDTSLDKQQESIRLYQQVLASHKISKKELKQSINYYLAHTGKLKAILDSITLRSPSQQSVVPINSDTPVTRHQKDTVAVKKRQPKLQVQ
jgi:hypothetical protein